MTPTAKLVKRNAKRCVRTVAVTTLTRAKLDGDVGIRLTARLGTKRLKAGSSYRLTVVATDAAGNRSQATSTTLKVVRR